MNCPYCGKEMESAYIQSFQQIYLNRAAFENKTPEEWEAHFTDPNRRYRVPGEALDFTIIWELAQKEQEGAWKESRLHQVVEYILGQM